jgi:hypothetical protein
MERDIQPPKPYMLYLNPKEDRAWFERKAAELKPELDKLPADPQEQLRSELEGEKE